ncbi:hypothetical protein FOL46_003267 [Perkinsus olseni]|nr:hypothetical protein FOL46_003267 [Perkinsus olseni]
MTDYTLPPSEAEVGIKLYLDHDNKEDGGDDRHITLPCLFKHRFQDFHVYEIPDGPTSSSPLHLTELWTKDRVVQEIRDKREREDNLQNTLGPDYQITDQQLDSINACLTEEDKDKLVAFLKTSRNDANAPKYCLLDGDTIQDKPGRTKVHQLIKTQFPSGMFITDTVDPCTDTNDRHQIRVWIKKDFTIGQKRARELAAATSDEGNDKKRRRDGRHRKGRKQAAGGGDKKQSSTKQDLPQARYDPWPKDQPDYLYFNMYKENRDTAEAVSSISRAMGKKNTKAFTVAGTKDRRGVTVQHVCMWRTYAEQVKRAMLSGQWDKFVRLSDFHYRPQKLSLGMLYGNRFYVALRGIKECPSEEGLTKAFNALSTKGFINYFGMQRFGTQLTRTYEIGQAMVARDWVKAVRLIMGETSILRSQQEDNEEGSRGDMIDKARRAYLIDNDPEKSLKLMPRMMHIERKIITSLAKDPNGHLAALQQLPTPTLSLYVHSLQSFVWNHAVTHRLEAYGPTIVVGDIVLSNTRDDTGKGDNDDEQQGPATTTASSDDDDTTEDDGCLKGAHSDDDEGMTRTDNRKVVHITVDNISDYSIYDVVLPLPGSNTEYPENMQQWYKDFTSTALGLSLLDDFKSCTTSGGVFNLPGSYRNILERAEDVEYEVIQPERALDRTLIPTDIDKITKRDYTEEKLTGDKDKTILEGTYSIAFKTTLKSGTYLTMALRELTRQDTSRNSMRISDSTILTDNNKKK